MKHLFSKRIRALGFLGFLGFLYFIFYEENFLFFFCFFCFFSDFTTIEENASKEIVLIGLLWAFSIYISLANNIFLTYKIKYTILIAIVNLTYISLFFTNKK